MESQRGRIDDGIVAVMKRRKKALRLGGVDQWVGPIWCLVGLWVGGRGSSNKRARMLELPAVL